MSPMSGIELEKLQEEEDRIEKQDKEARELKEAKDKKEALKTRIRRVNHGPDKSQEVPESAAKSPPELYDDEAIAVPKVPAHYAEMEQMVERLKVCDFTFKSLLKLMGKEIDHQSPGLEQAMSILAGHKNRNELITKIVHSLNKTTNETLEDLENCAVQLTDMITKNYFIMDATEYRKLQAKEALKASKVPKS